MDSEYYSKLVEGQNIIIRSSVDKDGQPRGRGVFATKDFRQGEIIFVDEPFASIADTSVEVQTTNFALCSSMKNNWCITIQFTDSFHLRDLVTVRIA